ncbi:hypothetical protein U1Q18_013455 [Sarracenia purpurea var. burkii]
MKQGLLAWSPCRNFLSLPTPISLPTKAHFTRAPRRFYSISATLDSVDERLLTGKERRQLRKERRENKPSYNWREEVEERLMKKPKKRYASWTEELNLDNLALLGPRWWVVTVSRVSSQERAEMLARALARIFPDMDFKVYVPAVQVKRKLKNGSHSVKPKPLFPGCVFLWCVMNKEVHDSIRECDGIRGFVGSKVGNTKKQINKPRPVSNEDIEVIFQKAKDEQEKADQAFEEEQRGEGTLSPEQLNIVYTDSQSTSIDVKESVIDSKPKKRTRKTSQPPAGDQLTRSGNKVLRPGSTVRVVSGTFAEFAGILKQLDLKTGKATVGFTLFGKETLVDVDVNEIVVETK